MKTVNIITTVVIAFLSTVMVSSQEIPFKTISISGEMKGEEVIAYGAIFSNDETLLAIVAGNEKDAKVYIYETKNFTITQTLMTGSGSDTMAFSLDNKFFAQASNRDKVKLYELSTGEEVNTFVHGPYYGEMAKYYDSVNSFAFSPDTKYLIISVHSSKHLSVWDINTGEEVKTIKIINSGARSIKFSPDGKKIFIDSVDGFMYDFETGEIIHHFKGYNPVISPDFSEVINVQRHEEGFTTGLFDIWDAVSGKLIRSIERVQTNYNTELNISPTGKFFLDNKVEGNKNNLVLNNIETKSTAGILGGLVQEGDIFYKFSPSGKYVLAYGGFKNYVNIYDLSSKMND